MKMIAGLGNPGREYERTAHNVGFDVVDELCRRLGGSWQTVSRFNGRVAKVARGSDQILLVQPQTFMNDSGHCVGPLAHYYRIEPKDIVAVSDDADLPPGRLRVRPDGGTGGHRGLASLVECLGTGAFARVRVGIGHGSDGRDLAAHVLGRLPDDVRRRIDQVVPVAADAALAVLATGVTKAMERYNGFTLPEEEETAPSAAPAAPAADPTPREHTP